ncbi:MAG: hypothetical protein HXS41_12750 [Theionarchaea archaeon]|nr:hypothetical protein [Theionarchaea archaeon]MBU7000879.1 hypothetical protein [Theionarchaea archaeon]MBU7021921.1 hypothetical protein [Theionarchaea archaeon]MBU7035532.1 hypothetical protein [Theionarchaea archaeon]MBU7040371.1 hypothetical protein [Theionarchaea archaeon]
MNVVYFDQIGRDNTEKCIDLALKRAGELGIEHVVVASTTGFTIERVVEMTPGMNVVGVTHSMGFKKEGGDEFEGDRENLKKKGVRILTTTHLMSGLNRGVRSRYGSGTFSDVVADTLRMFSQGMKVCVEIAVMALDSGLIPAGKEVVVIGGTGRGADTAVVVMPAHSQNFFDTRVLEVICKPREG